MLKSIPAIEVWLKKNQAAGNWGARGCPEEGQIDAAKTGAGFSVAGVVFNPLKPKRESAGSY
jgi:hypothetical protein